MKTFLFSCFLLCCTLPTTAQYRYIPYVEEGKYWFFLNSDGNDTAEGYRGGEVHWIGNDTILGGKQNYKLYQNFLNGKNDCVSYNKNCFEPDIPYSFLWEKSYHFAYLREDTVVKNVYYRSINDFDSECGGGSNTELYDFNLKIGDTLSECHLNFYNSFVRFPDSLNRIGIIDSVYYKWSYNKLRKVFRFNRIERGFAYRLVKSELIEGVGINASIFLHDEFADFYDFCEDTVGQCHFVSAVQPLRPDPAVLDLYPNPAGEVLYLRTEEPAPSISLWDHCGVPVAQYAYTNEIPLHTLPAGIYILRIVDRRNRVAVRRFVKR